MKRVSTKMQIYSLDKEGKQNYFGETEYIENSGSPQYKKVFRLCKYEERLKESFAFVIYDEKTELGEAIVGIDKIASHLDSPLKIPLVKARSNVKSSIGFCVINAKRVEAKSSCTIQ